MSTFFFHGDKTETTLVQNNHHDEVLNISMDDDEILSIDQNNGDYSPRKDYFHPDLIESSDKNNSLEVDMSNNHHTEKSKVTLDSNNKTTTEETFPDDNGHSDKINDDAGVSNTFYDEELVLNDDSSSVETNDEDNANDSYNDTANDDDDKNGFFDQEEGQTRRNVRKIPFENTLSSSSHHNNKNIISSPSINFTGSNNIDNSNTDANKDDNSDGDQGDEHLPPELVELFQCINDYTPREIEIETKLKCFIPNFIPAVGSVDPFIKVPRPDKVDDGLGLIVIDEPSSKQSDAAVLELQLQAQLKKKMKGRGGGRSGITSFQQVRSIENASKNGHEIDRWVESVRELRISRPLLGEVQYIDPNCMPSVDEMMAPFPQELQEEFNAMMECLDHQGNKESSPSPYTLLDPQIDLTLEEYAETVCALLDVPVVDGNKIQSLHCLFNLCIEFQKDFHDDAISVL